MNNIINHKNSEKGMYFIFMALSLVVLLSIVSLGIDLGKMHRDYLYLQKAADAGVTVAMRAYSAMDRSLGSSGSISKIQDIVQKIAFENLRRVNLAKNIGDIKVDSCKVGLNQAGGQNRETLTCTIEVPQSLFLLSALKVGLLNTNAKMAATSSGSINQASVILLLDYSGSMCVPFQNGTRQGNLNCLGNINGDSKIPANNLIRSVDDFLMRFNPQTDRIGVITFGTSASEIHDLNNNWNRNNIMNALQAQPFGGQTNPSDALLHAWQMLFNNNRGQHFRSNTQFVFFTDGTPTAARFLIRLNDPVDNRFNSPHPNLFNIEDSNDNGSVMNCGGSAINWDYFDIDNFGGRGGNNNANNCIATSPLNPVAQVGLDALRTTIVGDFYNYLVGNQNQNFPTALLRNGVEIASIPNSPRLDNLSNQCFYNLNQRVRENRCVERNADVCSDNNGDLHDGIIDYYHYVATCSYQYDNATGNPQCVAGNNIGDCGDNDNQIGFTRILLDGPNGDGIRGNLAPPYPVNYSFNYNSDFRTKINKFDLAHPFSFIQMQCMVNDNNVDMFVDQQVFTKIMPKTNLTSANAEISAGGDVLADRSHAPNDFNKISSCFVANNNQGNVQNRNFEFLVPVAQPGAQTVNHTFGTNFGFSNNMLVEWQEQYFNAAIAYADAIRNRISGIGGAFYVIGLGRQDTNLANGDFYQYNDNHIDDDIRKDYFLTRLALDPGSCLLGNVCGEGCLNGSCSMEDEVRSCCDKNTFFQIDYPQKSGQRVGNAIQDWRDYGYDCGMHDEVSSCIIDRNNPTTQFENRYRFGTYYPTQQPNELRGVFQLIADRILLSTSN